MTGPLVGWVFLVKYDGKAYPANLMSITYEGKNATFAVWAPFFSHIVVEERRRCAECHGTSVVKTIVESKQLRLTWWNETAGGLDWLRGSPTRGLVIPVVEGVRYEMLFVKKLNYTTGEIAAFAVSTSTQSSEPVDELGYAAVIAFGKPLK
ncbi:MAG: hypothetical protein QXU97_05860 [Fervidicoccaceae archaeon]